MMPSDSANVTNAPLRAPGPFGPVIELLPKHQAVETVTHNTPVYDAIERMTDHDYSQLPVTEDNRVIGLFSWRSVGKRVGSLGASSADDIQNLKVRECLDQAQFLPPDAFIDTGVDWTDKDCVLVGSPDDLLGVLAIYDVVGRLQDFGEAFFLIHEVEHLVRDMITEAVDQKRLSEMLATMTLPPGMKHQPHALTDLTFAMYGCLVCSRSRWPEFEPMFLVPRKTTDERLKRITEVRNVVFHFKRPVTVDDVDELRRFRTHLHQLREAFHRKARRSDAGSVTENPQT